MSIPPSPETPSSTTSSSFSTHTTAPSPEVVAATHILNSMKQALEPLQITYDTLEKQVGHIAMLGGHPETSKQLNALRKRMDDQDRIQLEGIEEIQLLLKVILPNQMIERMRQEIEKEYASQIDELVEEQVAICLKTHIPEELQNEVAESKRQLEELQQALHNSESRRANASLQLSDQNSAFHTIYAPNGEISADYPRNLAALKALDAETSKRLMAHYGIPDVSEERERNINRFMQFCGLPYQITLT